LLKYSNLITAYHDAVASISDETRQKYVSAQQQVELIANNEIVQISKEFYTASVQNSPSIMSALIKAMRKDLNINR
jgi:hypothetical protein